MIDASIRRFLGLSPALPSPANQNDSRLPCHSDQQAHFARLMVENALAAVEAAERRLVKLERKAQRKRLRSIKGGRRL
jgi:hypothetical protein